MSATQVVVGGTLKPDGTLELDEKPDLPSGRVRVTLMAEEPAAPPTEDWWDVLERIDRERAALGLKGRSREEIDAEIAAWRAEDAEYEERWRRIHDQTENPLPPQGES